MNFIKNHLVLSIAILSAIILASSQIVGAHGTHYSQIHVTSDSWLATDSGKVGVGTTNPVSKLDVEENGVFTNGQQNPLTRSVVQDGASPGWDPGVAFTQWQGGPVVGNHATEAGTFGINIPSNSTVYGANGVASYIRNDAKSCDLGGTCGVAGYFQAVSTATDANIFGINPVLIDAPDETGQRMSNEFDFHVHENSTDVAGIRLYLGGSAPNPTATAFQVARSPGSGAGPWDHAYYSFDGAAEVGIYLGANGDGNDQPSQEIQLNGKDTDGTSRTATIQGNAIGAIILRNGKNGSPVAIQDHNNGAGANIAYFNSSDIRFYTYLTFDHLAGSGNSYACMNAAGTIFRSDFPCR